MRHSNVLPALLGVSIAGITGTLLFYYWKDKRSKGIPRDVRVHHIKVPREMVAILIGREGKNLKALESQTGTTVSFIDPGGPFRVCAIRGSPEDVQLAEELISNTVRENAKVETLDFIVSDKVMSRLTAEGNKHLRHVTLHSKARIYIDDKLCSRSGGLLIRGTREQIEKCCDLIRQLVSEEDAKNPDISRNHSQLALGFSRKELNENVQDLIQTEQLYPSDAYVQVFVSAVANPHKFYVQIVGPRSTELDRLVENMTEYYSKEVIRRAHPISQAHVGALVASPFSHDDSWYRARVVSMEVDEYDTANSRLHVYFVDFGDRDTVLLSQVCELQSEFLSLKCQAIECRLANVEPLRSDGEWDAETQEVMSVLTHCTEWVVLMARVLRVDDNKIPVVHLVDTSGDTDVDIGAELVSRNLGRSSEKDLPTWSP